MVYITVLVGPPRARRAATAKNAWAVACVVLACLIPNTEADCTVSDEQVLGCYVDTCADPRTLPHKIDPNIDGLTYGLCATACYNAGYNLAGAQYGGECWCGITVGTSPLGDPSADGCIDPQFNCPGDPSKNCGGKCANMELLFTCTSPSPPPNPPPPPPNPPPPNPPPPPSPPNPPPPPPPAPPNPNPSPQVLILSRRCLARHCRRHCASTDA